MTQIAATDSALIRLLKSCGFPSVDIASGPHEWDGAYVQRLLTSTPAIRVVFMGAEPHADTATSTSLNMEAKWAAYVIVGWNGQNEKERRIGAGAGYDLLHRTASAVHSAILMDDNGDRLPIASVTGLDVLADSALDLSNLWIAAVEISVELPLDLMPECTGPLDDFLRVRATFDIEGGEPAPDIADAGTEGDLPVRQDLEQ